MRDPVHLFDYVVDYYTILGLSPEASIEDITTAIRTMRAENHPDRVVKLSKEIQDAARRQYQLATEAEDMLLDPAKKSVFDERLAWFQANLPQGVTLGNPKILVGGPGSFDLPTLLGHQARAFDADAMEMIEMATGYDPSRLENLQALWESNQTPLHDQLLRDELIKAYAYFLFKEQEIMKVMGLDVGGKYKKSSITHATQYAETHWPKITGLIEEVLPKVLGPVLPLTQTGMVSPLLLTGPNSQSQQALIPQSQIEMGDIVRQAMATLDKYRNKLESVIQERQAILVKLAELLVVDITPPPYHAGEFMVVMFFKREGETEPRIGLVFTGNDHSAEITQQSDHDLKGTLLTDLRGTNHHSDIIGVEMVMDVETPLIGLEPAVQKRRKALGFK